MSSNSTPNHSFIHGITIASPCKADWAQMTGDERARFCGDCKLHVYNLSSMSETEAEKLIIEKEGKLCLRLYRRSDGTVLTKDCPVGFAAKMKSYARRSCAGIFAIASVLASYLVLTKAERPAQVSGSLLQRISRGYHAKDESIRANGYDSMGGGVSAAPFAPSSAPAKSCQPGLLEKLVPRKAVGRMGAIRMTGYSNLKVPLQPTAGLPAIGAHSAPPPESVEPSAAGSSSPEGLAKNHAVDAPAVDNYIKEYR
jgi:hypothetical protein